MDAIYMGENQDCLLGYTLKGESIKCQINCPGRRGCVPDGNTIH